MASSDVDTRQKKSKFQGFCDYLYNSETKAFFGRTPKSWGQITIFYLVFYSCLAGFFAINVAVFFTMIDRNYPRLDGMQTPVKNNPGMGFRPMPNIKSTLIRFEQGKPESYKIYTDHIQAYLEQYEKENQEGENYIDCSDLNNEDRDKDKVCSFNLDQLGPCTKENTYGYFEGQPCILLKLNKVFGFEPEPISNDTVPSDLQGTIQPGHIGITCEGENPADRDFMGPVSFYPNGGFPNYYFPYRNQEGYRQPLVFVKFDRPKNGALMQIWCKAWAGNIKHHKNDKAGSIHFELMVD